MVYYTRLDWFSIFFGFVSNVTQKGLPIPSIKKSCPVLWLILQNQAKTGTATHVGPAATHPPSSRLCHPNDRKMTPYHIKAAAQAFRVNKALSTNFKTRTSQPQACAPKLGRQVYHPIEPNPHTIKESLLRKPRQPWGRTPAKPTHITFPPSTVTTFFRLPLRWKHN